ncbi:hypothetical protein QVD99_003948 [Batrachochytrium dendrobatidis]|nr:hypothetical protein O5D80_002226 [Batrachochytrium dendrobatidis]KAK5669556.1 hypothetical protein QVD99_003948 [Batrachochytrium dendrobatidis]
MHKLPAVAGHDTQAAVWQLSIYSYLLDPSMSMTDSVVSKNLFAVLGDSSDTEVSVPKVAPVKKAAPQKQTPQPKKDAPTEGKSRGDRTSRPQTGNRQVNYRNPTGPRETGPFEQAPEQFTSTTSVRLDKRGGGRGRGGRDHDRRSAAGHYKAGEKKDVAGKGTWGDAITAEVDENGNPNPVLESEDAVANPTSAEPKEADPEDSFKTLEQFMAEKKKSSVATEVVTRKANEGVDETKFKGVTKLEKPDEEFFGDLKKSKSESARKNKEKAAKATLDIQQTFTPVPRDNGRFERNDRKAPRRDGEQRNTRNRNTGHGQTRINVADTSAFPSLGSQ